MAVSTTASMTVTHQSTLQSGGDGRLEEVHLEKVEEELELSISKCSNTNLLDSTVRTQGCK